MENRTHIIEANETLLSVTSSHRFKDKRWIRETTFFGQAMTDAEVFDELTDDDITLIRRMNVDTWISEDITEEVARKYLYRMDEREGVELDDEDRFPAYVRNSRAWALWKDDLEARRPYTDPDRRYDERRDHQAMGWIMEAAE